MGSGRKGEREGKMEERDGGGVIGIQNYLEVGRCGVWVNVLG